MGVSPFQPVYIEQVIIASNNRNAVPYHVDDIPMELLYVGARAAASLQRHHSIRRALPPPVVPTCDFRCVTAEEHRASQNEEQQRGPQELSQHGCN
jgi:hypothetical protein